MSESIKILVADDEPIGRQLLEAILMPEGYKLVFGTDGQEAFDAAVQEIPDIILLDVMMPKMDGFEVCKKIRSNSKTAHIPVYLITALDDRDSRIRGIDAGADDYISKPFDRIEILGKIKNKTHFIQSQKNQFALTQPPTGPSDERKQQSSLLNTLLEQLLTTQNKQEHLLVRNSEVIARSKHVMLHDSVGGALWNIFASNELSGKDAPITNAMVVQLWKELIRNQEPGAVPGQLLSKLQGKIEQDNPDILSGAEIAIAQIFQAEGSDEVHVAGVNQSVLVWQKDDPLLSKGSGYQSYYLPGNQELKFRKPATLLLLSRNIHNYIDEQEVIRYLNNQLSNLPIEGIVDHLLDKFDQIQDILIAAYSV